MVLKTNNWKTVRHAWLSAESLLIVGPLIIISSNVLRETGTALVWELLANIPLKVFFTCRISLLTIIAALAKQNSSVSLLGLEQDNANFVA